MRSAVIALAFVVVAVHARAAAAACEVDEHGDIDTDACEEELAAFDERFAADATFFETFQLELGSWGLAIRWSDDEDEDYVEYEIENDFDDFDDFDDLDDGTDEDTDDEEGV